MAGGGGLITVPALLAAGLPPIQALSTNKLQSTFGSLASTWNVSRRGHLDLLALMPAVVWTALGAAMGALTLLSVDSGFLTEVFPFLLLGVVIYFVRPVALSAVQPRMRGSWFFALFGVLLGFYDGFFGPGKSCSLAESIFDNRFFLFGIFPIKFYIFDLNNNR